MYGVVKGELIQNKFCLQLSSAVLPDFYWYNISKREKIYKIKYTKWPQNIPRRGKIYEMATKYTTTGKNIRNGHKIYQNGKKFTKWPLNIPNGHKICIPNGHKICIPNGHKIYQMVTKYTKWSQNIPNGQKIYQMAVKWT
jgi:hypothetical protein